MKEQSNRAEERDFRLFRENGDPQAMARVFDAVAPKLLLVAGHLARDAGEAEDLVQATFLAVLEQAGSWDGERPLVPWMVGILSHRAIDQGRRSRLRRTQELEEGFASGTIDPLDLVSKREVREAIARSVDQLEPPYREVLVLRVAHGLEPTEIAHTLGRSPGTVRMQLKRGREQLERALPRGLSLPAFLLAEGTGLGAVRAAVLAKASAKATATMATVSIGTWTLGGLLMKGTLAAVGALGLGAILWFLVGSSEERQAARSGGPEVTEALEQTRGPLVPSGPLEQAGETRSAHRVVATRARGVEVAIHVTFEEDGTPAADVGVYVKPVEASGVSTLGVEIRTDVFGLARLPELERGTYRIDLDRWGREPVQVEIRRDRTIDLAIPDGVDVQGMVVDTQGIAVPGAEIFRLSEEHHDYLQWVATADPSGFFRLRDASPSPLLRLVARADGFQPSSTGKKGVTFPEFRASNEKRTVDVRLVLGAPGHAVSGRVLDESGNPVSCARIVFAVEEDTRVKGSSSFEGYREQHRPPDLEAFSIRTDPAGFFRTRQVPAGSVTWFAQSVGEEASIAVGALEVAPGQENELQIVLGPGAGVFGVLTDEEGEPVSDCIVEHEWRGSDELGQLEAEFGTWLANRSVVTAQDGSFELLGLLPGETGLELRHPSGRSLQRERVELELGQRFRWAPRIERSENLAVRLVGPEGEALVGWGVGLSGSPSSLRSHDPKWGEGFVSNATDAEGRYTFRGIRTREWLLSAHAPGESLQGIPPPIAVREGVYPGEDEILVQVAALPTGSVRGRVQEAAGSVPYRKQRGGIILADVQLNFEDFEKCGRRRLDEDGAFAIEPLPPGAYRLVLTHADGYPGNLELTAFEIAKGQSLDLGVLIPPLSATLEVELVAKDGGTIEDPEVTLQRESGDPWRGRNLTRDRDGPSGLFRFRSGALEAGAYILVAHGDESSDIAPFRDHIELEPGETLRKRITVTRGKKQIFELTLPPHPNEQRRPFASPSARIEVQLYDEEGQFLLGQRDHFELFDVSGNRLRLALRLAPGAYRVFLQDQRDPALRQPRPSAEIELRVPESGEPDLLLVELD